MTEKQWFLCKLMLYINIIPSITVIAAALVYAFVYPNKMYIGFCTGIISSGIIILIIIIIIECMQYKPNNTDEYTPLWRKSTT